MKLLNKVTATIKLTFTSGPFGYFTNFFPTENYYAAYFLATIAMWLYYYKATQEGHRKKHKKYKHEDVRYPFYQCEYEATTEP